VRILVTGGAGYVGSVLVPALLAEGHTITVLDNFLYQQTSLLDCCIDRKLSVIRGDARDTRLLDELVPKADAVFPLACLTGAPSCARDPITARTVNLDAVGSIAERMSHQQIFVFPSTNSGYGVGEANIHCDEETPLRPVSLYGRLKVEMERRLLDRGHCVTFRFATLFGISPRMRLDLLVNDFTYRAVVDRAVVLFEPHFKRNYLHVRDAARAFLHTLDNYTRMEGRPYNVGLSDANLSKWELCETIRRHVPDFTFLVTDVGHDPDRRNYIVSNRRIEEAGFKPAIGLDEGIAELVRGYQILRRSQYANA
jgi:nucleoside-diphosphate-sugar epimerase